MMASKYLLEPLLLGLLEEQLLQIGAGRQTSVLHLDLVDIAIGCCVA